MRNSESLMDAFCVFFLLSSHFRRSAVSVVFDFNKSLNIFTPASPKLQSVEMMRMEKSEPLMDALRVFFSIVFTTQVKLIKYCV